MKIDETEKYVIEKVKNFIKDENTRIILFAQTLIQAANLAEYILTKARPSYNNIPLEIQKYLAMISAHMIAFLSDENELSFENILEDLHCLSSEQYQEKLFQQIKQIVNDLNKVIKNYDNI